ncbi:hypothetical protein [Paracoccus aminovorans]|uniref:DUF7940 domain-containing protein n=1 Tax=Paracoccus aminovorans TaxID=34004 RepID=UPI0007806DB8|nr:hypothetical protein [Paracoccus aminovorans]
MKLVSDWRRVWRYYSTQAMAIAATVQLTWAQLPDDMRASVPPHIVSYATGALLVLGVIGRLVDQGGKR